MSSSSSDVSSQSSASIKTGNGPLSLVDGLGGERDMARIVDDWSNIFLVWGN